MVLVVLAEVLALYSIEEELKIVEVGEYYFEDQSLCNVVCFSLYDHR